MKQLGLAIGFNSRINAYIKTSTLDWQLVWQLNHNFIVSRKKNVVGKKEEIENVISLDNN